MRKSEVLSHAWPSRDATCVRATRKLGIALHASCEYSADARRDIRGDSELGEIIGYNDYSRDEYVVSGPQGASTIRATKEEDFFFRDELTTCPFCSSIMQRVYHAWAELNWGTNGYEGNVVLECSSCRWWEYNYTWECEGSSWDLDDFEKRTTRGIAKRFDLASATVPLDILSEEATRRPEVLYETNPTRFEQLVGHVFSAHYNCEVIHCGRSNDRGIDLILVNSDSPVLIQVKRRSNPRATEKVSAVREFLGSLVLQQARKGIFVSTAKKFSASTHDAAASVVTRSIVDQFDLFDFDRFCAMLRTVGETQSRPWEKLLRMLEVEQDSFGTLDLKVDCYDINSRRPQKGPGLNVVLGSREPEPVSRFEELE